MHVNGFCWIWMDFAATIGRWKDWLNQPEWKKIRSHKHRLSASSIIQNEPNAKCSFYNPWDLGPTCECFKMLKDLKLRFHIISHTISCNFLWHQTSLASLHPDCQIGCFSGVVFPHRSSALYQLPSTWCHLERSGAMNQPFQPALLVRHSSTSPFRITPPGDSCTDHLHHAWEFGITTTWPHGQFVPEKKVQLWSWVAKCSLIFTDGKTGGFFFLTPTQTTHICFSGKWLQITIKLHCLMPQKGVI